MFVFSMIYERATYVRDKLLQISLSQTRAGLIFYSMICWRFELCCDSLTSGNFLGSGRA